MTYNKCYKCGGEILYGEKHKDSDDCITYLGSKIDLLIIQCSRLKEDQKELRKILKTVNNKDKNG